MGKHKHDYASMGVYSLMMHVLAWKHRECACSPTLACDSCLAATLLDEFAEQMRQLLSTANKVT